MAYKRGQFLRKLSTFLDRAFGSNAPSERRQRLVTWAPMMMDVVVQLVSSGDRSSRAMCLLRAQDSADGRHGFELSDLRDVRMASA